MNGFKDMVKNGWHPEKEGTTFKSQVKGVFSRDKGDDRSNHVARPLSSLRDPSSFAPPPRRDPNAPIPIASSPTVRGAPPPTPQRQSTWGSTASSSRPAAEQEEGVEAPPRPYRVDTTGLSTAHLPPPPGRRDGADGRTPAPSGPPPPYQAIPPAGTARSGPPSLPPRLPPRGGSISSIASSTAAPPAAPSSPTKPQSGSSLLNQGAVNRLGAAGISVPSLGIGSQHPTATSSSTTSPSSTSQMNELQSRFARLGQQQTPSVAPAPVEGTTWQQKQAALKTASAFHKDPSSVSASDAKAAASTFNNFRQRHGDQVQAGMQSASNANQKYGIANRMSAFAGTSSTAGGSSEQAVPTELSRSPGAAPASLGALGKKKPAPPPPKKKPGLSNGLPSPPADDDAPPPPVPMATRPQF